MLHHSYNSTIVRSKTMVFTLWLFQMSMMNTNTLGINPSCWLSKALIHSINLVLNEYRYWCLSKRNRTLDSYMPQKKNEVYLLLHYREVSFTSKHIITFDYITFITMFYTIHKVWLINCLVTYRTWVILSRVFYDFTRIQLHFRSCV